MMDPPKGLCAPNTTIIDFAYLEDHPLRLGNYPTSARSSLSSDYDFPDQSSLLDEINLRAIALFDFKPENDNEVELKEGQIIWISYRNGQGWLVAENPVTGENGLVPEEYVEVFGSEEAAEVPKPFMPQIFLNLSLNDANGSERDPDDEWEDIDEEPL